MIAEPESGHDATKSHQADTRRILKPGSSGFFPMCVDAHKLLGDGIIYGRGRGSAVVHEHKTLMKVQRGEL